MEEEKEEEEEKCDEDGEEVIMKYLVKISKKARLLELKQRHLKKTDSDIQYAVSKGVNDPSRVEFQPKRARLV
ncbi:hypothetical protein Tco_0895677 [Tanacetum coccineum]|uniref:Uncharacterized protein n=1 Tax=Tanacetum coccineum TaxID=301880 RepID=A0ABQ5CFB1_9ASTR